MLGLLPYPLENTSRNCVQQSAVIRWWLLRLSQHDDNVVVTCAWYGKHNLRHTSDAAICRVAG